MQPSLVHDGVKCVLVDLQQVQYIDSAALGNLLLLLRGRATPLGIKVELANVQGTVKDVLEIAYFREVFTIS